MSGYLDASRNMRLWSKMVDAKVMHNFYVPIKWEICVESLSFIHPLAVLNLSHALKERCLRKDGTISRICPTCLPIHQIHYTTSTREPPWYSTSPLSPMVTPWILDSILTAIMGSIIEFIQLPSLYEICTLKVYHLSISGHDPRLTPADVSFRTAPVEMNDRPKSHFSSYTNTTTTRWLWIQWERLSCGDDNDKTDGGVDEQTVRTFEMAPVLRAADSLSATTRLFASSIGVWDGWMKKVWESVEGHERWGATLPGMVDEKW